MSTLVDPYPAGSIDLHAHTNESDGSLTPRELVELAKAVGLDALAITDHDTFNGYEKARRFAAAGGLDLVCGIELNARVGLGSGMLRSSLHLLAYFLSGSPASGFMDWLEEEKRRMRNPEHAGQGTVADQVIAIVRSSGGVPVIAHPVRLALPREEERKLLIRYREAGLLGLEVYHSEHAPELQAHYRQLAEELELLPTGGSDFHGALKPDVQLGTGLNGNVRVPRVFLENLRSAVSA